VDQTQRLLLAELEDRLERIFEAIEELREATGDGKRTRQLLESIFRDVHSLKAASAINNLQDLNHLSHEFENLLHALRTGKATLNNEILTAFQETADAFSASLNSNEPPNSRHLIERLASLGKNTPRRKKVEVDVALNSIPADLWQSLTEAEKHRLEAAVSEGAGLYLIETSFDIHDFDQQFQELRDRLTTDGEVISTAPKVDADNFSKINFRVLYARDADLEQIRKEFAKDGEISVAEVVTTSRAVSELHGQLEGVSLEDPARGPSTHLIRIDLDDLDRLISRTHQLFRKTSSGFDHALNTSSESQRQPELANFASDVSRDFMKLASELVNLRMVSIDRVLQRTVRAGRSAALASGKQIDFVVHGRELVLDKSLSDAIADPLVHLVRNAVDHGIESPDERKQSGKPVRGTIRIEATTVQGQTRIAIADDGRGINSTAVAEAAFRLGVLEKPFVTNLDQSVRLIFRPGLSTATQVSETSGRGVGLDAVETAVEEVGGAIRVASEPGQGATFEIRLPVTFGLLNVAMVWVDQQRYILDTSHVIIDRQVGVKDLEWKDGVAGIEFENEIIPVLRLDELLGQAKSQPKPDASQRVLICRFTSQNLQGPDSRDCLGLLVDSIADPQQVLVRNLGSRGGRWFGIAGAAELRDGSVVLLLDLPRLMLSNSRPASE